MTHFLDENYYEILSDFKVSGFQTDILACWLLNDVHKCVILTLVIGGNFLVFRIEVPQGTPFYKLLIILCIF